MKKRFLNWSCDYWLDWSVSLLIDLAWFGMFPLMLVLLLVFVVVRVASRMAQFVDGVLERVLNWYANFFGTDPDDHDALRDCERRFCDE